MSKIIDLETQYPNCSMCAERTRHIIGYAYDAIEAGRCTAIFDCKNEPCKKRKNLVGAYLLRRSHESQT